jgi:hypothetical protein
MSRDDNCYYSNDLAETDTDTDTHRETHTDTHTHTVDQLSDYSSDPAIHGAIPTHEPEEAGIVAAGVGVGEEEAAAGGSEGNVNSYGELVRRGDVWWDGGVGEFRKVPYIYRDCIQGIY